ncbi:MAG: cytochrome c [Proteobacteria bacterium]|nr:cytochrome c [Pseudomonadota bacterium]NOG58981.1 cytochrome c [Pseudomonadota bacterium]
MTVLNKLIHVSLITLLLFSASAQAVDIENGKALHDANCLRCHDETNYTRENRIINSYEALRKRINDCEIMAEMAWFDEEIDDVTAYLNSAFYHFNLEK